MGSLGDALTQSEKDLSLPPEAHRPPSASRIEELNLPEPVKNVWIETAKALEENEKATFGDWIILTTQMQVNQIAQILGFKGKIKIEKFESVIDLADNDVSNPSLQQVGEYVENNILPYYKVYLRLSRVSEEGMSEIAREGF